MDTMARHFSIIPPMPQATRPFSYAAGNAARYTLAPFRQDRAKHAGRKIPTDKPGKSGNEISLTCNAIMYEQYIILYYIVCGPPVGDSTAMHAHPLRYKREALTAQKNLSGAHTDQALSELTQTQAIQHTVDVGYYALAARTTLNRLCSSCS
jgi:hypothetical protein